MKPSVFDSETEGHWGPAWRTVRVLLVLLVLWVALVLYQHAGAAPPPRQSHPPMTTTPPACPWVAVRISAPYGATLELGQPLFIEWGRFGDPSQVWRTNAAALRLAAGEWIAKWPRTSPPTPYTITQHTPTP